MSPVGILAYTASQTLDFGFDFLVEMTFLPFNILDTVSCYPIKKFRHIIQECDVVCGLLLKLFVQYGLLITLIYCFVIFVLIRRGHKSKSALFNF